LRFSLEPNDADRTRSQKKIATRQILDTFFEHGEQQTNPPEVYEAMQGGEEGKYQALVFYVVVKLFPVLLAREIPEYFSLLVAFSVLRLDELINKIPELPTPSGKSDMGCFEVVARFYVLRLLFWRSVFFGSDPPFHQISVCNSGLAAPSQHTNCLRISGRFAGQKSRRNSIWPAHTDPAD